MLLKIYKRSWTTQTLSRDNAKERPRKIKPQSAYYCDANDKPKYWLNKLQSKGHIIQECAIRNMDIHMTWTKTITAIIKKTYTDRSQNA